MTFQEKEKSRSRLLKLMNSWGKKTRQIKRVTTRIASLGSCEGMKPSTFRKFTKFMEQVTLFRDKERDIISEIDSIEQKHRLMRKKKLLKAAKRRQPALAPEDDDKYDDKKKRRNRLWLFLFIIWLLWESGKQHIAFTSKPEPR